MLRILFVSMLVLSSLAHASELSTASASYRKLPLERWFDGTVEAVNQATVSAETKGRVARIYFDVGDTVPAGSLILTLVSDEQRQSLNQSTAQLNEARANLEAENKEYERIERLFKQNIVSKSDWDKVVARLNVAKARVSSAEAALKTAEAQLSYTEIRAPYGGVVSARHVELGEAVFPGKALMSGFDPNTMRVLVDLPQATANKVKAIKQAKVIWGDRHEITPTKLVLYPVADPTTSTVRTRLELPDTQQSLYPGEFVKVGFTIGDIQRLLIPCSSIVYRSEVTGIYVVKDKTPSFRQIRIGNIFGDHCEVLAGLRESEEVATDPIQAGIILHTLQTEASHG